MAEFDVQFTGLDTKPLESRRIDTSGLSSWQREKLSAAINNQAFFSAKITDGKLLASMQDYIAKAARGEEGFHRDDFIKKMKSQLGFQPWESAGEGVAEISSVARLKLIYEFNLQQLAGQAQYLTLSSDEAKIAYPCLELVRVEQRKEPRDWVSRWKECGGKFYRGRMIAPIGDEVWIKISRFGNPYPPFDYNSGMGLKPISRLESVKLGAYTAKTEKKEQETTKEFPIINAGLTFKIPSNESQKKLAQKGAEKATKADSEGNLPLNTAKREQAAVLSPKTGTDQKEQKEPRFLPQKQEVFTADTETRIAIEKHFENRVAIIGNFAVFVGAFGTLATQAYVENFLTRPATEREQMPYFAVSGIYPKNITPAIPTEYSKEISENFSAYVFDKSISKEEVKLCCFIVSQPTRITFNKLTNTYIFSAKLGENFFYAYGTKRGETLLFITYGGRLEANA